MKWWIYLLPTLFALSPALILTFAVYFNNRIGNFETKLGLWPTFLHAFFLFSIFLNLVSTVDLFLFIKQENAGWVFCFIMSFLTIIHKFVILKKFPLKKI